MIANSPPRTHNSGGKENASEVPNRQRKLDATKKRHSLSQVKSRSPKTRQSLTPKKTRKSDIYSARSYHSEETKEMVPPLTVTTPTKASRSVNDNHYEVSSPVGEYIRGQANTVINNHRVSIVNSNNKRRQSMYASYGTLGLVMAAETKSRDDNSSLKTPTSLEAFPMEDSRIDEESETQPMFDSPHSSLNLSISESPASVRAPVFDECAMDEDSGSVCYELIVPASTKNVKTCSWLMMTPLQQSGARGSNHSDTWRNRFVCLINNIIFVYKDENATKPLASILIDKATISKISSNVFKVDTRVGRAVFFKTFDIADTDRWVNTLEGSKYESMTVHNMMPTNPHVADVDDSTCQYCVIL